MKAIRTLEGHKAALVDHPIPELRPSYLLIKVKAVTLNPIDYKLIDFLGEADRTLGSEVAGVVEEVGSAVTAGFKKGDRVMAIAHGCNTEEKDDGCFAEYAVVKGDIAIPIPEWMTFEEASAAPMGALTAGLALYQQFGLPEPGATKQEQSKRSILIYGASSATGLYCVKLAKLSGLDVWATCSPRNFDLVTSAGASHAYDYSLPTCAADIRRDSSNSIRYAVDCISTDLSIPIASAALSDNVESPKPMLHVLRQFLKSPREDIRVTYALTYTLMGEAFGYKGGSWFEASEADFEWAKRFAGVVGKLLEEKKLIPMEPAVQQGGLDKVLEGIDLYRQGKVSGQKLVYRVA